MEKIIKLIDVNFDKVSGISLNLATPVEWSRTSQEYDIAIYTDDMAFSQKINSEKINCVWLLEPPVINGDHIFKAIRDYQKFNYVFSFIKDLNNKINNFVYVPAGGTWMRSEDMSIDKKTKNTSMIFSWKNWTQGHNIRHGIYNMFKECGRIDFFGSGCSYPINLKIDALRDYRFSIAIENSIESDYFTEKLLDCFLTGTVPIYWGTRNIVKYFDANGFIFINDENELLDIIDTLTEELYNSKMEAIQKNFETAKKYIHPEKIIDSFLKENVK